MRKGGVAGGGVGAGGGPGWHIARPSQLPWRVPIDRSYPTSEHPFPPPTHNYAGRLPFANGACRLSGSPAMLRRDSVVFGP